MGVSVRSGVRLVRGRERRYGSGLSARYRSRRFCRHWSTAHRWCAYGSKSVRWSSPLYTGGWSHFYLACGTRESCRRCKRGGTACERNRWTRVPVHLVISISGPVSRRPFPPLGGRGPFPRPRPTLQFSSNQNQSVYNMMYGPSLVPYCRIV